MYVFQANLHFHEKHLGHTSRQTLAYLCLIGASLRLALLLPGRLTLAANPTFQARWQAYRVEAGAAWNEIRRRQALVPQT